MNLTVFTHDPIFSVVTILLQMLGFILTIKYYDKKPTFQKVKKLLDKEIAKHPDDLKYDIVIDLETPAGGRQDTMNVPKSIATYLEIRRKSGLFFVLFGLCLQILPFVY